MSDLPDSGPAPFLTVGTQIFDSYRPVYRTAFVGGRPSHATAARNSWVNWQGSVEYRTVSSWTALSKTKVYLAFLPKGGRNWSIVSSGFTDSHGRFDFWAHAGADGTWRLIWNAPNQSFLSTSTSTYVTVH